jgi:hypothetical protein
MSAHPGEHDAWLRRGGAIFEQLVARARKDITRLSTDRDPAWESLERQLDEYVGGSGREVPAGFVASSLARCQVVVVGGLSTSLHGLELAGRLMRRLPGCTLALNLPSSEHQEALDAFLDGKLDHGRLSDALGLCECLPVYACPGYVSLLELARTQGSQVVLYESDAHHDVAGRDEDALLLLDAALHACPGRPLLVLAGELRVSPASLLGGLHRLVGREGVASVYCDLPGPYLRDILRGGNGRGWSSLGPGRFCECRQSPLASLQSFLSWHAHGEVPVRGDRLAPSVAAMVKRIARFVGLELPPLPAVTVLGPGDPRLLAMAAASGRVNDAGLEFLAARMGAGESRMVPEADLLYLGNIACGHVAEEAAHWLRSLTGGAAYGTDGEDAFWGVAVHELLGFFGSKVVSPERRPVGIGELGRVAAADRGEALAHVYGYNLAERLFRLSGDDSVVDWVRALCLQDLVEPGTAKRLYLAGLDLAARTSRSRKGGTKASGRGRKGR